jgi:DNA-binding LacI/PurR family transcriptional regulator
MAITMQKVAKLAGTSQATVSDVLRGQWKKKGISEKTYKRVIEVAQKADYRPNRIARSLVRKKTQVIGVQLAAFLYDYMSSLLHGLDTAARKHGYHILLAAPAAWQEEGEELKRLYEHQVDGLILNPQVVSHMELTIDRLRAEKVPMVFLGTPPRDEDYLVTDDNIGQATLAVEHLIRLGHKRIAHIAGPDGHLNADDRRKGYLRTMERFGLPTPPEYTQAGNFDVDLAGQVMKGFLQLSQPPTAVYCANDPMAAGALKAIEEAQLLVPADISIVGHGDDIPFSWLNRIPLTTIHQPAETTAEIAIKTVIDLIEERTVETTKVELPGKLIIRKSSGPPKVV